MTQWRVNRGLQFGAWAAATAGLLVLLFQGPLLLQLVLGVVAVALLVAMIVDARR